MAIVTEQVEVSAKKRIHGSVMWRSSLVLILHLKKQKQTTTTTTMAIRKKSLAYIWEIIL